MTESNMTEPDARGAPAVDRARIETLVRDFYGDVRTDALLAPVFGPVIGDDWGPHLARMVDFWSTVMLGARSFRGNVFAKHMVLQGVRDEHFLRWITLWHRHTNRLFDDATALELQRTAHGIGRNLFYGLLGEVPSFVMRNGEAIGHVPDVRADRM